ncbi:MAG: radical SAM protein [Candidatus Omnitrophota bacterium]
MIPCTNIFRGLRTIHTERKRGPLFAWNITARCNLRCSHCYRDSRTVEGPGNDGRDLSDEKCIQLIDEIKRLDPPMVLLTGGEPLLRKNVFDIVKKCKASGLRIALSTNGTLIDRVMAQKIETNGVDYVGISIDGRDALHDEFRGLEGASGLSWDAIKYLNSLGVKTGVRFTLTDKTKGDLFHVLDRTVEAGTKRFCLYHLVYSGRGMGVADISPREKREIMTEFFSRVKALSLTDDEFEVLTTDNHADGVYMLQSLADDEAAYSCIKAHGGCSAGDRVIYLDSTGDVYPCQFLREESLGNVIERSLVDIWEDEKNPLLKKLRNKENFLQGRCGECAYKNVCGGCRARARARSGSLWDEDPACYLEEKEILV